MAEQILIIEDGTLTKFECDDYRAERYTKDNFWRYNEHITEFREIETDAGKQEGEA